MLLELNLDVWEPVMIESGSFGIKNRKTNQYIGTGKSLKIAILKARDFEMSKLKNK